MPLFLVFAVCAFASGFALRNFGLVALRRVVVRKIIEPVPMGSMA